MNIAKIQKVKVNPEDASFFLYLSCILAQRLRDFFDHQELER